MALMVFWQKIHRGAKTPPLTAHKTRVFVWQVWLLWAYIFFWKYHWLQDTVRFWGGSKDVRVWPGAAERGISGDWAQLLKPSCGCLQLAWHPRADLLCLLSSALLSSTFTIWCEAWIAALFSLSCGRNFYHEHKREEQEHVLHLNNDEPGKSVYSLWSGICVV